MIHGLKTAAECSNMTSGFCFPASMYDYDPQGWCGGGELFGKLIELTRPKLIIEVGTWKGKSALTFADLLKSSPLGLKESKVICVDTWLGATEFIDKPSDDPKRGLMSRYGYPGVYYQFLANVFHKGHEDRIVPFPQSSINAARYLDRQGARAELIYIDASHEYQDVYMDLQAYAGLLKPGGIMFGDDYCDYWRGVIEAVDEFEARSTLFTGRKLTLQTFQYPNEGGAPPSDYWVLSDGGLVI